MRTAGHTGLGADFARRRAEARAGSDVAANRAPGGGRVNRPTRAPAASAAPRARPRCGPPVRGALLCGTRRRARPGPRVARRLPGLLRRGIVSALTLVEYFGKT